MTLEASASSLRAVTVLKNWRASEKIALLLAAEFGHPQRDELLHVLGTGLQDFVPAEAIELPDCG